ncbi:MAG: hypothetical protein LAT84_08740 [Balneolia bacterium]|nr:hypothetical protein [Balneolia bacterium]
MPEYLGGDIVSITSVNNILYFTDLSNRQINVYGNTENDSYIQTYGNRGRGPGEYEFPYHVNGVNNQLLAWSDITKSEIIIADLDGRLVQSVVHPYGGGRKFSINDEFLLVTPGFSHLINIIEIDNNENRIERFELSSRDKAIQRVVPGGGGILLNDRAVATLPHKPVFYIYDMTDGIEHEVVPQSFQKYFDDYKSYVGNINRPSDINADELYESLFIINRVHRLEHRENTLILIEATYQSNIRIYVFDEIFNLLFSSDTSFSPLGASGSVIYGAQVSIDDDAVVSIISKDLTRYFVNLND